MTKRADQDIFEVWYQNYGRIGDQCVYCGLVSNAMDHIPPISAFSALQESEKNDSNAFKVPCCTECNSILGSNFLFSVWERREYTQKQLVRKYKKLLKIPKWSEEELEELDEFLSENIRTSEKQANQVRQRIAYQPHPDTDALSFY